MIFYIQPIKCHCRLLECFSAIKSTTTELPLTGSDLPPFFLDFMSDSLRIQDGEGLASYLIIIMLNNCHVAFFILFIVFIFNKIFHILVPNVKNLFLLDFSDYSLQQTARMCCQNMWEVLFGTISNM